MAKHKKRNKKSKAFSKTIKLFINNKRLRYTIIGAAAAGVALVAALSKDKPTPDIETDTENSGQKKNNKNKVPTQADEK